MAAARNNSTYWWRVEGVQIPCLILLVPLVVYQFAIANAGLELSANDFGKFYYATSQWFHGVSMYAPSAATRMRTGAEWRELLDMNPPHFHLLIVPLLALPLRTAAVVWLAANVAAAVGGSIALVRELEWSPRLPDGIVAITAILLCGATSATLITGQYVGFLLAVSVAAWRAARHHRWIASGLWLGVLIALKPFLAVFVPYLVLGRHWRALAAMSAAGAASYLIGVAVFGWTTHVDWWHALGAVDWTWAGMNASLEGIYARTLRPSPYFAALVASTSPLATPLAVRTLSLLTAAIVGLTSLWIARRSIDHAFAALLLCALLISPLGWVYYLWLAAPPCLALWQRNRPLAIWLALPCLAVPLVCIASVQPHGWATATIGSAYGWGTLLLWISVAMTPRAWSQPVPQVSAPRS